MEMDFVVALRKEVLQFIEKADDKTAIGIPIAVIVNHICNTFYYDSYTYTPEEVRSAVSYLEQQKISYYSVTITVTEEMKQEFPDIANTSRLLLVKKFVKLSPK